MTGMIREIKSVLKALLKKMDENLEECFEKVFFFSGSKPLDFVNICHCFDAGN